MATLAKKSLSWDLKKHNGIRACICCYMAGAPSDRVGLLELWNKKAEWRIRREEGQFGQCPKEKVFFSVTFSQSTIMTTRAPTVLQTVLFGPKKHTAQNSNCNTIQ